MKLFHQVPEPARGEDQTFLAAVWEERQDRKLFFCSILITDELTRDSFLIWIIAGGLFSFLKAFFIKKNHIRLLNIIFVRDVEFSTKLGDLS